MSTSPDAPSRKQARLAVRLTHDQDSLIRDAANVTGQSLTEFVITSPLARAKDTFADRRVFRLDDTAWTEFNTILNRPAQRIPELAALLADSAPWDQR